MAAENPLYADSLNQWLELMDSYRAREPELRAPGVVALQLWPRQARILLDELGVNAVDNRDSQMAGLIQLIQAAFPEQAAREPVDGEMMDGQLLLLRLYPFIVFHWNELICIGLIVPGSVAAEFTGILNTIAPNRSRTFGAASRRLTGEETELIDLFLILLKQILPPLPLQRARVASMLIVF